MSDLAVPLITAGISGLAGLFGGRPKTTTTTTDQTQNQQFNQGSSTTPNLNPFQQLLMENFTRQAMAGMGATNLGPYTQQGLQQIGIQGNLNRQVINNALAARGLSYSPAAGASQTQNLLNTGAQQNQFLAGIPLLQRQFQQQGLQGLLAAFGAIPTGQTSTSSGSSSGTLHGTQVGQQPGNMLGGFLGGLGAGIPAAFPQLFSSGGGGQQQLGPDIMNYLPTTQPSQTQNLKLMPGWS